MNRLFATPTHFLILCSRATLKPAAYSGSRLIRINLLANYEAVRRDAPPNLSVLSKLDVPKRRWEK